MVLTREHRLRKEKERKKEAFPHRLPRDKLILNGVAHRSPSSVNGRSNDGNPTNRRGSGGNEERNYPPEEGINI